MLSNIYCTNTLSQWNWYVNTFYIFNKYFLTLYTDYIGNIEIPTSDINTITNFELYKNNQLYETEEVKYSIVFVWDMEIRLWQEHMMIIQKMNW